MIYGVTRPDTGSIHVFGLDIGDEGRRIRARIGVTLQESVLIEALDAFENLVVFGRYYLMREPDLSVRAHELMERLELDSHAGVAVKDLSGGFKRRLAVALSLMSRPDLLILDEPTTGLDPAVRIALWELVRELRRAGTTVLLTTHYMDEAERLCDRLAIFSQGRVIAAGSPKELILGRLAREAVEFECEPGAETRFLTAQCTDAKTLRIGSRTIVYVGDATPVVERIRDSDPDDRRALVVRPTNLEDVFLSLTGTRLEGDA